MSNTPCTQAGNDCYHLHAWNSLMTQLGHMQVPHSGPGPSLAQILHVPVAIAVLVVLAVFVVIADRRGKRPSTERKGNH